jgi:hypothetical protein
VLESEKIQLEKLGSKQPRVCSVWVRRTVRWCTGQCLVRQASVCQLAALGFRRQRTAINHRTVRWCTGLSGEPTALNLQRSASPKKERNPHRAVSGGASNCPVRQATEGKNCLPGMLSTAPSCLGAIKGTPRRMEEYTKHSLSIPKHQDFNSAHSILCDSN